MNYRYVSTRNVTLALGDPKCLLLFLYRGCESLNWHGDFENQALVAEELIKQMLGIIVYVNVMKQKGQQRIMIIIMPLRKKIENHHI